MSTPSGELPRLVLRSASRAGDAGYLAAADLAALAGRLGVDYRLVGGNAVTLLVALHGVADRVPARETADADFGAPADVVGDDRLPAALADIGYAQQQGNRFVRTYVDDAGALELTVDVLAPSSSGSLDTSRPYGQLFVDEIPGLAIALNRPPQSAAVEVTLSSGVVVSATLLLPDVVAALVLKAYAYEGRFARRDAVDVLRLLEAAAAAGVSAVDWPVTASGRDASRVLHRYFGRRAGTGVADAVSAGGLPVRLNALVQQVVAAPQ